MKRTRATTLIELMVVVLIFALMMTLILGFYVYASSVTRKRDRDSARYRRVSLTLDKVETLLQNARIYVVTPQQVVFSPVVESEPTRSRCANWDTNASVLLFQGDALTLRTLQGSFTLLRVEAGEKIVFGDGGHYIDVSYNGPPRERSFGEPVPAWEMTRRVLVEIY